MRILQVSLAIGPHYGGPSKALISMTKALGARGHEVVILTHDADGPGHLRVPRRRLTSYEGVDVRFHRAIPPAGLGLAPSMALSLRQELPRTDVVHIHSIYRMHAVLAGRFAERAGVPYIVRPHGTLDPYQRLVSPRSKALFDRAFGHRLLANAAAVHFTAEVEAQGAADLVAPSRAAVIPLATDIPDDTGPAIADRGPTCLYLARVAHKKRPELLIEAWPLVCSLVPDATLVVAGPDHDGLVPALRARAAALGVADRVRFPGLVGGEDKSSLLRSARVFALPSDSENFGIGVAEAMSYGLPIVTTSGVAVARHLEGVGRTSVLDVDPSPQLLAHHLTGLLTDDVLATAAGESARRAAMDAFDWARTAAELEALYEESVATAQRSP